ncbi:MAG TPA: hypothetical protein VJT67_08210, partial [Longimicrobiaceae bacterium]|nr:hypothetical protein [Longimicrobiaceae bacterium]
RAELPLARMRLEQRKSRLPLRFRTLVPLAAAAGVVGAFALGVQVPGTRHQPRVSEADRAQVEQILDESMPDVGDMVGGSDQLLTAVGS